MNFQDVRILPYVQLLAPLLKLLALIGTLIKDWHAKRRPQLVSKPRRKRRRRWAGPG